MSRVFVDNSRLSPSTAAQVALNSILDAEHELCCCAPTLVEFAFRTRSAAEHGEGTYRLCTSFLYLPASPNSDQIIVDIRITLWHVVKGCFAGVTDVAIAAAAVNSSATFLHYDSDFDHVAGA